MGKKGLPSTRRVWSSRNVTLLPPAAGSVRRRHKRRLRVAFKPLSGGADIPVCPGFGRQECLPHRIVILPLGGAFIGVSPVASCRQGRGSSAWRRPPPAESRDPCLVQSHSPG